jgi:penicillin amidase
VLLVAGAAVAGVLGFAALLGALYVAGLHELPPASGQVTVEGLSRPVRVVRDLFGVPHIEGEELQDVYAGLGFAHAQDRLWQMEVLRRAARGSLSELFGPRTLPADRLARALGLVVAAEKEIARLDPPTRSLLASYSAGVNAWVREVRERRVPRPLELAWLGVEPAPFSPVDAVAILRLRAWMLGRSLGASLILDRLVREIGGVASEAFFPDGPEPPPVVERVVRLGLGIGGPADLLTEVAGLRGPVGSLGVVVRGDRTRSGYPALVNDPHVEFQLPSVFYVAHLRTEDLDVAGATWPGVPVFWTGATRTTAWGQVALHANVSDLFEETLDATDPERYDLAGRWVAAERREERISVRGGREEHIEVLTTRHGPLLGSVLPRDPAAAALALRWTGQHRESGIRALLALPFVADFAQLREALRELPSPPTAVLYASRAGEIGVQVAGDFPIRTIETGLLPVPGRTRWYDWRGTIPFDDLPFRTGEKAQAIVVGPRAEGFSFPLPVSWLWGSSAAPLRMRRNLEGRAGLTVEDLLAMQRETRNTGGVAEIQRLLEGSDRWSSTARRVHGMLASWDGSTGSSSVGPAVYHTFRMRLLRQLLLRQLPEEQIDALLELSEPVPGAILVRYLERAAHEVYPAMVHEALEETWGWLASRLSANPAKWSWGRLHQLELPHAFRRLGSGPTWALGRMLSRGPFPAPGDPGSVWTMYSDGQDPFRPRVGPAFRLAIDLGDPLHARFDLCGGQSGLPGSEAYSDGIGDWLRGRPRVLWMHPADVAYHSTGGWELEPDHR